MNCPGKASVQNPFESLDGRIRLMSWPRGWWVWLFSLTALSTGLKTK